MYLLMSVLYKKWLEKKWVPLKLITMLVGPFSCDLTQWMFERNSFSRLIIKSNEYSLLVESGLSIAAKVPKQMWKLGGRVSWWKGSLRSIVVLGFTSIIYLEFYAWSCLTVHYAISVSWMVVRTCGGAWGRVYVLSTKSEETTDSLDVHQHCL